MRWLLSGGPPSPQPLCTLRSYLGEVDDNGEILQGGWEVVDALLLTRLLNFLCTFEMRTTCCALGRIGESAHVKFPTFELWEGWWSRFFDRDRNTVFSHWFWHVGRLRDIHGCTLDQLVTGARCFSKCLSSRGVIRLLFPTVPDSRVWSLPGGSQSPPLEHQPETLFYSSSTDLNTGGDISNRAIGTTPNAL